MRTATFLTLQRFNWESHSYDLVNDKLFWFILVWNFPTKQRFISGWETAEPWSWRFVSSKELNRWDFIHIFSNWNIIVTNNFFILNYNKLEHFLILINLLFDQSSPEILPSASATRRLSSATGSGRVRTAGGLLWTMIRASTM